jgi:hypothetical protein
MHNLILTLLTGYFYRCIIQLLPKGQFFMPEKLRLIKSGNIEVGKIEKVGSREVLLQGGTVEDLTRQGRVLTAWDRDRLIFIPPVGVTFGDKVWQFKNGGLEFFVAGKSVGSAELIMVNKGEGEKLLARRDAVLKSIGRDDTSAYEGVSDEDVYRDHGKYRVRAKTLVAA